MIRAIQVCHVATSFVAVGLCGTSVIAQWSHNPSVNLGISVGGSDQAQPKIVPTADGGCYVSWLDGIGTGWDTRLQRLDARGFKLWPDPGVLVADTAFSSTEDYGIDVDADGNAIIAYRDNSTGTVQIELQKVDPKGNLLWDPNGVQVSNGASNSPKVCVTSDGAVIAAWTQSGVARIQRLDPAGAISWAPGGVIDIAPVGIYLLSDLVADSTGGAITLYHHQTGGFSSPRHLKAQKFDATGAKVWNGGSALAVWDGGSIQLGNFPRMIKDNAGGFITSWYNTGGSRNAHAQHINAAGAETFPHNGVTVADDIAGRIRVGAAAAYDANSGVTFLFAVETNNPGQNIYRIVGQRIDSAGARLWTSSGVEIAADSSNQPGFVQAVAADAGVLAFWFDKPGAAAHVVSAKLNEKGAFAWSPSVLNVSSVDSAKGRLHATLNAAQNRALVAWHDARSDANDIYGQSINVDGTLGNPGDANDDGNVDVDDLLAVINSWGACPAYCPADLNSDGATNVDDLLAVINNWG